MTALHPTAVSFVHVTKVRVGPQPDFGFWTSWHPETQIGYDQRRTLQANVRKFGAAFMRTFADYPIIRLRLRPGEAYVAPVENFLHDSTSADFVGANHFRSLRRHFCLLYARIP